MVFSSIHLATLKLIRLIFPHQENELHSTEGMNFLHTINSQHPTLQNSSFYVFFSLFWAIFPNQIQKIRLGLCGLGQPELDGQCLFCEDLEQRAPALHRAHRQSQGPTSTATGGKDFRSCAVSLNVGARTRWLF